MDLYLIFNTLSNIVTIFVQNAIWVIGFFYLLTKTFENPKLKQFSKYAAFVSFTILFINSFLVSI